MPQDKSDVIKNPDPIVVKITDFDGKVHELTAKTLSPDNLVEYKKIHGPDILNSPYEDQLIMQMAWTFGNDKDFYRNFDVRVLKKAINKFAEEIENPI